MPEHGRSGGSLVHSQDLWTDEDGKRSEVVCLAPALLAFFYGTGRYGEHGATWNSILLFGGETFQPSHTETLLIASVIPGIAISRIGLWSFDLCQVCPSAITVRPNRIVANIYSSSKNSNSPSTPTPGGTD